MTLFLFSRKAATIKPVLSRTAANAAQPAAASPADEKPQPVFRSVRTRPLSRM